MRGPREVPCNGCHVTYTPGGRACSTECEATMRRNAARYCSTPETRAAEARAVRAEAPTLLEVVTRHEAINRITDAIASGALSDAGVVELLAHAERLKGAA